MDDKLLILDLDTFSGSERFMTGSSLRAAFSLGMRAYLDGRYADAVGEFNHALIASIVESDAYAQIWDRERAIIHLYLGNAYAYQDSWAEALNEYMDVVQIDAQLAEAHYNLGVAFRALGKINEAVAAFKVALEYNPDLYESHFALGRCYHKLGEYAPAYISYTLARQLRPNAAEPIYYQGVLHQAHGETKQAAKCFAEARQVEPEYIYNNHPTRPEIAGVVAPVAHDADWYYRQAENLKTQGNPAGAIRAYQELLSAHPGETRARYYLANIFARQREWERAIYEYKLVLQADAQFIAARYKLGLAYRAANRLKESYNTLVQCARQQPGDGVVYLSLGIVLTDLKQLGLALKAFERAAQLLPTEPQVHYRLGRALIAAGYEDRAMLTWQTALKLDENWQACRFDLGILYLKRGRFYEAARTFEILYKQLPEDVETAYMLGLAYKEIGRLDETIQLLAKVVRAKADHFMAHFHLGSTYLRLGNKAQGLVHMREYEKWRDFKTNPPPPHQAAPVRERPKGPALPGQPPRPGGTAPLKTNGHNRFEELAVVPGQMSQN
jgi:tetratricopeptide (TPR) repeat protein